MSSNGLCLSGDRNVVSRVMFVLTLMLFNANFVFKV